MIQGLHKMLTGNIQVWVPACSTSDAGEISMREGLTSASARQSLRIMFWMIPIFDFSCISNQAVSTARGITPQVMFLYLFSVIAPLQSLYRHVCAYVCDPLKGHKPL